MTNMLIKCQSCLNNVYELAGELRLDKNEMYTDLATQRCLARYLIGTGKKNDKTELMRPTREISRFEE